MPRAFGIMSLWDNDYFGHTLQQAAQLIGQDPQVLKTDAYQNMRGGAALLRQIYDNTPKPADAPDESQIESWREAIAKYTGIPQPELSEGHALRVYEYMNLGYHEYGIDWKGHPVNLGPMREAVAKIKADALAKKMAVVPETNATPAPIIAAAPAPVVTNPAPAHEPGQHFQSDSDRDRQRILLLALMGILILIAVVYLYSRKGRAATKSGPE
jgi:hypothetical protein